MNRCIPFFRTDGGDRLRFEVTPFYIFWAAFD